MMLEFLKNIPLFSDLSDEDLYALLQSAEKINLAEGEYLFSEGDEGDCAFIIYKGKIEILKTAEGREILLAVREPGTIIGEMSLLESRPRSASVRAQEDSELYLIQKENFDELLATSHTALHAMFGTILQRNRENQSHMRQSEKMAQLGTLTAGVAHELNNPAAAVQRGAAQLSQALESLETTNNHAHHLGISEKEEQALHELVLTARAQASQPMELDALARSDREYAIESWLEDHQIEDAWQIAPNLVNLNFDEEGLKKLTDQFEAEHISAVIDVLNATYNVYFLTHEIQQGSSQISEIVKALKSYSFLDQAPVQNVDIHEGLNNTLLILKNKFKGGISVRREYAEDLPRVEAYGSELNQVWTNLLDNATDAVEGRDDGQIIIRTRTEGQWVVVEIEDNGTGIPKKIQKNIFDAFFTTKAPGKGTGMGLDISYRIIQKHKGDIRLTSEPGETCFSVWLPA